MWNKIEITSCMSCSVFSLVGYLVIVFEKRLMYLEHHSSKGNNQTDFFQTEANFFYWIHDKPVETVGFCG